MVGNWQAKSLGWGSDLQENLEMRKAQGKPGAPFGGFGFITPEVRTIKLEEFSKCAEGQESMYYWALQPIFDTSNHLVGAEILIRVRNGTDNAPFEDVMAIMDPTASEEVRKQYIAWKTTEMVDWILKTLKQYPILQSLNFISANVRPLDLPTTGPLFQKVRDRINALCETDRMLLLTKILIEVTEDQSEVEDLESALKEWKDLGFKLAYDDTIGEDARNMLELRGTNFHTPTELRPVLKYFSVVKVDINWAGFAIFLCHPSYNTKSQLKTQILCHAREKDLIYILQGQDLKNTGIAYSTLLAEFVNWALEMISVGKTICIELSVKQDDENNAFALNKLKDRGLDIFGTHRDYFSFQGGPTGAKAFQPDVLAMSFVAEN